MHADLLTAGMAVADRRLSSGGASVAVTTVQVRRNPRVNSSENQGESRQGRGSAGPEKVELSGTANLTRPPQA